MTARLSLRADADGTDMVAPPDAARAPASHTASAPADAAATVYPRAAIAWAGVAVFCLAAIVSTVDRGILNLVVDPVKHELGTSDVRIALLQGLAFGLFYAGMGIPLGLLADTVSRKWVLCAAILLWSAATMLSGLATSFGGLFACRMLVGFGEAALAPCAISMIADMFPAHRRGGPVSLYIFGSAVSGGLSIYATGKLLTVAGRAGFATMPLVGALAPWRFAFVACGAAGIVVVALLAMVPEPTRKGARLEARRGTGLRQTLSYLGRHRAVFVAFYLGYALFSLGYAGLLAWSPSVLVRQYGVGIGAAAELLGSLKVGASVVGSLVAAVAIDRVARRRGVSGKLRMLVAVPVFALPSALAALAATPAQAALALAWVSLVFPFFGTAIVSSLPELVPADMKGVASSLLTFTATIIGLSGGPLLVAYVGDHLLGDPSRIGTAMAIVVVPALLGSAALILLAHRNLRTALALDQAIAGVVASNTYHEPTR